MSESDLIARSTALSDLHGVQLQLECAITANNQLLRATNQGDVKTVISLLDDNVDVARVNSLGHSALSVAANAGHLDMVLCLLQHDADPTQQVGND